ncbi:MAG: putative membrane protein [Methanobacterium sp. Maddingley MBC34]|nr:MAG: putative membrane protein [Methanobacterium sp. Maddingley MBC34]
MIWKFNNVKPEIVFLILCLIFGIGFLLATPHFQVPDEPEHLLKSVHLSEGQIIPEKSKVFAAFYPPIPYIASASVMFIGNLFNFSPRDLIYPGRFVNLILYALIVYLAIRLTPVHKWVFTLLALMPMTLYEAASLSADSFTIAISFLLIAIFFKLAFDDTKKEVNMNDILILFVLGLMIALSKQIYIVLLLLFFSIPLYKFENRKKMFLIIGSVSLPLILIIEGWSFLVQGAYVPISDQVSVHSQIFFILSNPIAFLQVFSNTISHNFNYYLVSFVGTFGWIDTHLDTPLPNILVYIYMIVLILGSLIDNNEFNVNLKQKLVSLVTLSLTFISIFVLEYIAWTTVGNNIIEGVYGRYFIPIAPLFFLLFYNKKFKFDNNRLSIVIICFIVFILLISLFMIIKRFYIV